jgi:hypothetical protein
MPPDLSENESYPRTAAGTPLSANGYRLLDRDYVQCWVLIRRIVGAHAKLRCDRSGTRDGRPTAQYLAYTLFPKTDLAELLGDVLVSNSLAEPAAVALFATVDLLFRS